MTNKTTEELFQELLQAQTDYYNKLAAGKESRKTLHEITEELEKRGERPLGW